MFVINSSRLFDVTLQGFSTCLLPAGDCFIVKQIQFGGLCVSVMSLCNFLFITWREYIYNNT